MCCVCINSILFFDLRVSMRIMKGVRAVLRLVMIATRSNFTGGMALFKDDFKGPNIMCSIVDLLK